MKTSKKPTTATAAKSKENVPQKATAKRKSSPAHLNALAEPKTRPATAKPIPPAAFTVTMSTANQLGKVQNSKDSDMGIHMTQILNYYRGRVEAFEKDRMQWYDKL